MKKVVSLLLIVVLALSMVTVSSAASFKVGSWDGGSTWSANSAAISDLVPGDEAVWMFNVDNFGLKDKPATYTTKQLDRIFQRDVTVRVRIIDGGQNPFDNVDFEVVDSGSQRFVKVTAETIDPFCSTSSYESTVQFYFVVDGDRYDISAWEWDGEFANPTEEVDDDTTWVDTYDGTIAEAIKNVKDITLDGGPEGYGILAHLNRMNKGKKVYFRANNDSEDIDDAIFDRYKSIFEVYGVCQKGLDSYTGNFIEFSEADPSDYIYGLGTDGSLVELGRGGDMVPLYKRYYLSNSKIEIDEPVDDEPIDDEVPDNYNPGTGR